MKLVKGQMPFGLEFCPGFIKEQGWFTVMHLAARAVWQIAPDPMNSFHSIKYDDFLARWNVRGAMYGEFDYKKWKGVNTNRITLGFSEGDGKHDGWKVGLLLNKPYIFSPGANFKRVHGFKVKEPKRVMEYALDGVWRQVAYAAAQRPTEDRET